MLTKVKIGGIWYTIQLVPNLQLEDDCSGKVITGRAVIKLDDGLTREIMEATLLHEIIEAIDAENELKIKHRSLQSLATWLYAVLKENPKLFVPDKQETIK